jgi:RNA polymerase sigma-70 factor, ECF subfamily
MRGDSSGDASTAKRARFEEMIAVHTPILQVVARRLCREPSVAADLLQDTLERAWRHFDSLQDEARARGWLVRILRNTWLDQVRRRRKEVPMDEVPEPSAPVSDEPSWWEGVTIEDLRQAIDQLREPFRSAAVLHDLDGHTYREMAAILGIPGATAATRLHRAHVKIREMLRSKLGAGEKS